MISIEASQNLSRGTKLRDGHNSFIVAIDVLGSIALLNPNLVHVSNAHRLALVSIMMPHSCVTAESRLDLPYLLLVAGFTVAQNKPRKSSHSSSLGV
jgi:hypothetical protein